MKNNLIFFLFHYYTMFFNFGSFIILVAKTYLIYLFKNARLTENILNFLIFLKFYISSSEFILELEFFLNFILLFYF